MRLGLIWPSRSPSEENIVTHQDELAWVEQEYGIQPGFTTVARGGALVTQGTCPRCSGETHWSFHKGEMDAIPEAYTVTEAAAATIICACGHVHSGKPAGSSEAGCGAFWPINLPT